MIPMHFETGEQYHIYNRGNNQQQIFFNNDNYLFFLQKLNKQIKPNCDLLCWCLMPNHFHLIINANDTSCITRKAFGNNYIQELSYQIGKLIGSYSQAINKQNNSGGSLFQQRTKAKHLTSPDNRKYGDYLTNVMHYCHQNAWKAGLVKKIEDWP